VPLQHPSTIVLSALGQIAHKFVCLFVPNRFEADRLTDWPYSFATMKSTIFDSDRICLTILLTSSFGSLVSERRMR
jgi:hypothetical protein